MTKSSVGQINVVLMVELQLIKNTNHQKCFGNWMIKEINDMKKTEAESSKVSKTNENKHTTISSNSRPSN